jgi:hypothetical protein
MLTDKKFYVIESNEYFFSPYIKGERINVLVRGTHVIFRSDEGNTFSNANVPDMDLNVILFQQVYYVVNVTMYKNTRVLDMPILNRLALLTDLDLKSLDMKVIELKSFPKLFMDFGGDYIYRHRIDDRDQGLLSYSDIEQYRAYIRVIVVADEAKKQDIEMPVKGEEITVVINLKEECETKIFPDKVVDDCNYTISLKCNPDSQKLSHDPKFKSMRKKLKKKKLTNKQKKLYIKQRRLYLYMDLIRMKYFSEEVNRQYDEQLLLLKDKVRRAITDEGGTLRVLL